MKVAVLTPPARIEKYYDISTLPSSLELIRIGNRYTPQEVLDRASDADFIFVDAISPVPGEIIRGMKNLKLIHSEGVAFNHIDLETASKCGVIVCNNAGANSTAVAEHAVMLMLAMLRRLTEGDYMVRTGQQFAFKGSFIISGVPELADCRVGLVGFGAIARATARLLQAFGCKTFYYDIVRAEEKLERELSAEYQPLEELVAQSDIVSLHLPVTEQTKDIVDEKFFRSMKPTSILINTARGELVDQQAAAAAIQHGWISGIGTDTLSPEPVPIDNPLIQLPEEYRFKVLFSPHIAGATDSAFRRMHHTVWKNILAVMEGKKPTNIVNPF